MSESEHTSDLLDYIRSHTPAVAFKYNDRMTAGIPDLSVSWLEITSWWEMKVEKDVKHTINLSTILTNKIQNEIARRLAAQAPTFFNIYLSAQKRTLVIEARLAYQYVCTCEPMTSKLIEEPAKKEPAKIIHDFKFYGHVFLQGKGFDSMIHLLKYIHGGK